jgi:hypothetical protein
MYRFIFFLASAVAGGDCQLHGPDLFTPGEKAPSPPPRYSLDRRLGGLHILTIIIIKDHPLNIRMRVCYQDCHEAGLCCYLVTHIENLLHL